MHGLCVSCHERVATTAVDLDHLPTCATCHRADAVGADRLAAAADTRGDRF
jgi:cytochrome c553